MKKYIITAIAACVLMPLSAQRTLNLDSCRALALRNNKQLSIARLKQDVAKNTRKAVRTKYLPKIDALGGYVWTSREISLLNDDQKNGLNNMGSNIKGDIATKMLTDMVQQGIITPQQAQSLGQMIGQQMTPLTQALNGFGRGITDAFRTNTTNMFAGSIMLTQPLYMGGAITAANKMADIGERLAASSTDLSEQSTIYNIDNTYWLVVSLHHKEKLAKSYLSVVEKLNADVEKMIREGVATRADGLKVNVKVNEAEMQVTQAEDGHALAKMLLCQLCGIPLEEDVVLTDELVEDPAELNGKNDYDFGGQHSLDNRPELTMLQNVVDMSKQSTKLTRAAYLPQLVLTGGYLVTNPNLYNGFQRKFGGVWNVGVLLKIPVWSWMEGNYKVRASKAKTAIANLELSEAREKMELQAAQGKFKMKEADRKFAMTCKNVEKAEENLRSANLGFSEGVISSTTVMEAQTAWLQAHSQKIDAAIDVQMSKVNMKKIYGELRE